MRRVLFTLAAPAPAALLCLPTVAAADTTVKADLVELNDSGASGTVVLTTTDDGGLKVSIRSKGLVPGQPHPQHIHGSAGGHHFMCPTVKDNDQDGDGILTNEEASGEYGTIFMALTTRGGATPQDGLDVARMPVADKQGRLDYDRTFSAKQVPDGLLKNLGSLHVVQHGIDVNGNDAYDLDALGESTFAANLGVPNVPEEATDPATCGVVRGASAAEPAQHGPEMGGTPVSRGNTPLLAAGAGLLLLSAAVALSTMGVRRRSSGR
jgi:hypothetical protein